MHNKNLFLALITLITFSAHSQQYSFGIHGGLNLSQTNTDFFDKNFGFNKSLAANAIFSDHYLVELNLGTTTLGYRQNYSELSGSPDFEYVGTIETIVNFHYFTIPVKFGYVIGDKIKFIPKIGIQSAILKDTEIIQSVHLIGINPYEEIRSEKHNTVPFNIAIILESELRCEMNERIDFSLFLGALQGITEHNRPNLDPEYATLAESKKNLHQAISLGIGLKYKLR